MPETSATVQAFQSGTQVATFTDPAGAQRQVVVPGDPATLGTGGAAGGEATVESPTNRLILAELRRISAYLSLLTGEVIADDQIAEMT